MTPGPRSSRPRRVLVTGASGFIGRHLLARLRADGHEVHGACASADDPGLTRVDLTDERAVRRLVRRTAPEVVLHLGGFTSVADSWDQLEACLQANVHGTLGLLQALADSGWPAERVVYVSSSEVYGEAPVPFREDGPANPVSPYSVSKLAAERYCLALFRGRQWPVTVVRPFNTYGPGQQPDRVVPRLLARARAGQPLPVPARRVTREFVYVDDVVDGIVRAGLHSPESVLGEVVNLCSGRETSLLELATTLLRVLGDPVPVDLGGAPSRPADLERSAGDPRKALALLGWAPLVDLEEGLRRTAAAFADVRQETVA